MLFVIIVGWHYSTTQKNLNRNVDNAFYEEEITSTESKIFLNGNIDRAFEEEEITSIESKVLDQRMLKIDTWEWKSWNLNNIEDYVLQYDREELS